MPKVFISFAVEDAYARTYLVGQAQNKLVPFSFTDMSVKKPFDNQWKTRCRQRIKSCDGVVALLSTKTRLADGAKWEMQCAVEEGVPIIGVHIDKDNKGQIPSELNGKKIIEWTWVGINNFISKL